MAKKSNEERNPTSRKLVSTNGILIFLVAQLLLERVSASCLIMKLTLYFLLIDFKTETLNKKT